MKKIKVGQFYKYIDNGYKIYGRITKVGSNRCRLMILKPTKKPGFRFRGWKIGKIRKGYPIETLKFYWKKIKSKKCLKCKTTNPCKALELLCSRCRSKK